MALIEVVAPDLRDMLGLFPTSSDSQADTPLKAFIALNRLRGSDLPGPEGTTVRYEGMIEFRGADIPPVLQFLMDAGSQVSAGLIVAWIVGHFRGRTSKVTINRREVNLDDEGNVRRVVEEEITTRRG
jgi:hypothetical protein